MNSGGIIEAFAEGHFIGTEGASASDDLDTINGGLDGDRIIIRAADSGRTVVVKDQTGNLQLKGDFSLDNAQDSTMLEKSGATWFEVVRNNLAA